MADGFFWNEAHAKIAKALRQWYAWGRRGKSLGSSRVITRMRREVNDEIKSDWRTRVLRGPLMSAHCRFFIEIFMELRICRVLTNSTCLVIFS